MLIERILQFHSATGGSGIPRGLSLSAVLSEVLMRDFDNSVRKCKNVFHYSRYIDDMIVISSSREQIFEFIENLKHWLPPGLALNSEKTSIINLSDRVKATSVSEEPLHFEYLGYHFFISNPTKKQAGKAKDGDLFRTVTVDIAKSKIKKIKTRISRAFISFLKTGDWELLLDRISYLTNNFSVYNAKAGGKKVAGIHHSYPLV
ncbi:reverse transcriptase [compost metagenome]